MSSKTSRIVLAAFLAYIYPTHSGHGTHTVSFKFLKIKSSISRSSGDDGLWWDNLVPTKGSFERYRQRVSFLRIRGGEQDLVIAPNPTREELDKGLECTMCLTFLCAPRTLPCGHSFCEQCILSWMRTGQRICPLCRSSVIAQSNECGLSPNFALELVCRYIYGDDYGRRLQELEDLKLIPPKAHSRLNTHSAASTSRTICDRRPLSKPRESPACSHRRPPSDP